MNQRAWRPLNCESGVTRAAERLRVYLFFPVRKKGETVSVAQEGIQNSRGCVAAAVANYNNYAVVVFLSSVRFSFTARSRAEGKDGTTNFSGNLLTLATQLDVISEQYPRNGRPIQTAVKK